MLSAILNAFREAFRSLRTNFFQTVLSVLGIIIGVGALVTMLALIDGLEKLARESIADSSNMESVMVSANTSRRIDGVNVPMKETVTLDQVLMDGLQAALPYPSATQLFTTATTLVTRTDTAEHIAVRYVAVSLPLIEESDPPAFGRNLTAADSTAAVVTINNLLAQRMAGTDSTVEKALGKRLVIAGVACEVIGIEEKQDMEPFMQVVLPLKVLASAPEPQKYSLSAVVNFGRIEDVRPGKIFIDNWFVDRFPDIEEPVQALANLEVVEQMETGFAIFRLVMSFLIGIAVVVGGVGVMNVLLMSIAERTPEIGVRKAVGANRRRIMTQFLSESVAVSFIGSFFGLLVGALLAVVSAAVISKVAKFEFSAVFSWQTMLVVGLVALITGIVFGTYPARRAAGLDPVRAIQRT